MTVKVHNHAVMRSRLAFERLLVAAVGAGMLIGLLGLPRVSAQSAAQTPSDATSGYVPTMTFDVTSVRQANVNLQAGFTVSGGFKPLSSGNLTVVNFSFRNLISMAYPGTDHKTDGFKNLPKELQFPTVFVVEAKADAATDDQLEKLPIEQVRLEQAHMIQVMLEERFNLKVHWETRDSSTFDLVVTKPNRLQTTGVPPTADELKGWGDRGVPPLYQKGNSRTGFEYIAHAATATDIVDMLQVQFGAPVTDKTGLTGKYYFDLHYFNLRASDEDQTNPWPPLETAIQDQLGLKLVPSHGPVRFLVIDHAEAPSAN